MKQKRSQEHLKDSSIGTFSPDVPPECIGSTHRVRFRTHRDEGLRHAPSHGSCQRNSRFDLAGLARQRRRSGWNRHLVYALYRHAGLHLAGAGAVPLAHGLAFSGSEHGWLRCGTGRRELRHSRVASGCGCQHPPWRGWDFRHALHCHGGDAGPATQHHSPALATVAVMVAMVISLLALWLTILVQEITRLTVSEGMGVCC